MRDLLPVALEVNNDPSVVYTSHDHQLLYEIHDLSTYRAIHSTRSMHNASQC